VPRYAVPQWQPLADELRLLRSLSGLSVRDLTEQAGLSSKGRTSRIELAQALPTLPEIIAWADATGATPQARERLHQLASPAHTTLASFRRTIGDHRHVDDSLHDEETEARRLITVQSTVIPGLLQTAEYTRRLLPLVDPTGRQDTGEFVASRLRRQEALYDPNKQFEYIITESALRCPIGDPPVMAAQYDRLANLTTLDNIRIGLLPTNHTPTAITMADFDIHQTDAHDDTTAYVLLELPHGLVTLHDPDDVNVYLNLLHKLSTPALYNTAARTFLTKLATEPR
jgi:transcriptional regulator with XRE-family HTH domain